MALKLVESSEVASDPETEETSGKMNWDLLITWAQDSVKSAEQNLRRAERKLTEAAQEWSGIAFDDKYRGKVLACETVVRWHKDVLKESKDQLLQLQELKKKHSS